MMVPHLRRIIYGRTQKAVLYLTSFFSATTFFNQTHISLARLTSVKDCLSLTWSEISRLISFFLLGGGGHIGYKLLSSCSELTYLYPGMYLTYTGLFESYFVGNK